MLDRLGPDQAKMMPRETVIEKLRVRGEPIRLFGEDNQATFFRLRKMELGRDENYKIMGWTNEIKSAMDQVLSFFNPYGESDQ
jgi:pre-mRNA-splicing factor 18